MCKYNPAKLYLYTIQIQDYVMFVPEGTEASFSRFSFAFLTLSHRLKTHTHNANEDSRGTQCATHRSNEKLGW